MAPLYSIKYKEIKLAGRTGRYDVLLGPKLFLAFDDNIVSSEDLSLAARNRKLLLWEGGRGRGV